MSKVLIVVHQLNIGGVQKSLIAMLNAIDYSKNDVTLYIRKSRIDLINEIPPSVRVIVNQFNPHHFTSIKQFLLALHIKLCQCLHFQSKYKRASMDYAEYINQRELAFELKNYCELKDKYDVAIAYVQGETVKFVAEMISATRKYIFWHGSTDENHDLHQKLFSEFNGIIGVSKDIQLVLQRLYPEFKNKIRYITNYVDSKVICAFKDEFTVPRASEGLTLCSCGRFTAVKGFDIALEAADRLKKDGVAFLWYFVGDGSEREKLETYITTHKLNDMIVITGMQKNPYPYMDACDVYVQPSREEAWPLAIREAKLLKKPIVTTATVGGMSQIENEKTGVIADFNAADIADKILRLYHNPRLRSSIRYNLNMENYEESKLQYVNDINNLLIN